MAIEIELKDQEYIKLGDALKVAGLTDTGGMSKVVVQDGLVKVDGKVCLERGAKLHKGAVVEYDGQTVRIK